jgi:putative ribosome biogenesis GTPase RsgA
VKKAVEEGIINETRYQNYLNILNGREMELQEWETR